MGSGISLNNKQATQIIIRDLKKEFNEEQSTLPLYTDDGYEIHRDFSDEVNLNKKIKEVQYYSYTVKISPIEEVNISGYYFK
jgi:hypothetical protein